MNPEEMTVELLEEQHSGKQFDELSPEDQKIWADAGKKPEDWGGKKATPSPEDPDFEWETGEADKKQKHKAKLSELKAGYMRNEDYTKKSQELAAAREKVKQLEDWGTKIASNKQLANLILHITDKAITKDGYNNEWIEKALQFAEGKLETRKEEIVEESDEIKKVLEDLDPDSPYAKILKQSLAQNKQSLELIKKLEGKIDSFEKGYQSNLEESQKKEVEEQVQKAQQVLKDTLDALADPSKDGGFEFKTTERKAIWRKLVISELQANPKEYKTEEEFVAAVKAVGKQWYDQLEKARESELAEYLKKKKIPSPPSGVGGGGVLPEDFDPSNPSSLQAGLEKALQSELDSKKS